MAKRAFWILAGLVAIGFAGQYIGTHPDQFGQSAPPLMTTKEFRDPLILKKIDVTKTGLGGTVAVGTFTIENSGDDDVKDIRIACSYSGESGTIIDMSNSIIFEKFKAHSTRIIRELNLGFVHPQATKTSCHIAGSTQIGANH
jgi:hypothetical protein